MSQYSFLSVVILALLLLGGTLTLSANPTPSITPTDAHKWLSMPNSHDFLLDVRTKAEWRWVGVPVISFDAHGPSPRIIQSQFLLWNESTNQLSPNPQFIDEIVQKIAKNPIFERDTSRIFVMCCCGGRSATVTNLLREKYSDVFGSEVWNVLYGFDGDKNERGQRRELNGWQYEGLPWVSE